jgi:hypothetical protein
MTGAHAPALPPLLTHFSRQSARSYFNGRRRKMQMTVKGRFLTPNICFDSVLTGEGPALPLFSYPHSLTLHQLSIYPLLASAA